jgi:hypothetical protein
VKLEVACAVGKSISYFEKDQRKHFNACPRSKFIKKKMISRLDKSVESTRLRWCFVYPPRYVTSSQGIWSAVLKIRHVCIVDRSDPSRVCCQWEIPKFRANDGWPGVTVWIQSLGIEILQEFRKIYCMPVWRDMQDDKKLLHRCKHVVKTYTSGAFIFCTITKVASTALHFPTLPLKHIGQGWMREKKFLNHQEIS